MNITHRRFLLASVLALAATGRPAFGDTVAQNAVDARQETQIWTTYALSPYLRAFDLKVSVNGGRATLTGVVDEDVNRDLASQIALGVGGIDSVDNRILVKSDLPARPRAVERSYGEMVDDASISSAIKSKLLWSKHAQGLSTTVDTQRGRVVLKGTAADKDARAMAGRLAWNTHGVIAVDNRITVTAPALGMASSAKAATHDAGKDVADGWITTKVKSMYVYSDEVDSSEISVETKDGIVTLSGRVDTGAERALAIELAQNVRGVKSVRAKQLTF